VYAAEDNDTAAATENTAMTPPKACQALVRFENLEDGRLTNVGDHDV
jgi:hypothetical protein